MQTVKSRRSSGCHHAAGAQSNADVCIKVACRVRPSPSPAVVIVDEDSILVQASPYALDQPDPFTFDHAFDQNSTQDIYEKVVEPVVEGVLSGINGTVFCYGQTGSGKTYTMEGTERDPGLLARLGASIFDSSQIAPEEVSVSFVEIYMEKLQDLLVPSNKVEVRETLNGSVYLANACERVVSSSSALLSCVKAGQKNRSVAATRMNERSSRSHSVFSVSVRTIDSVSGLPLRGVLHFVDLAGSESQGRTGAAGQVLEQSKYINQSLLGFGRVIGALGSGQAHVPYRDSKLTRILQDSLGGTAKTSLIVNVSPEVGNVQETLSSLRFGQGASLVKNAPRVNLVDLSIADLRKLLGEKDAEIAILRSRIVSLEGAPSPSPQKGAKWVSIGTPEKCRLDFLDESGHEVDAEAAFACSPAENRRFACAISWTRWLGVFILVAAQAYATNPGAHEGGFRQFLQERRSLGLLHRMLEKLGFIQVGTWDFGVFTLAKESSQVFLGAFSQWFEIGDLGFFQAMGYLDVLTLIYWLFFALQLCFPATSARHCVASSENVRAGRLWSVVVAQLWHLSLEQVVLSTLFLRSIGPHAHAALGPAKFFTLFFVGGCCAKVISLIFCRFLQRRFQVAEACIGACASLLVLFGYIYASEHCCAPISWLGREWDWRHFVLLQITLGATSGSDILANLVAGASGMAAAKTHLLDSFF